MDKKSSAQEILNEVIKEQEEKFDIEKLNKKVNKDVEEEVKDLVGTIN